MIKTTNPLNLLPDYIVQIGTNIGWIYRAYRPINQMLGRQPVNAYFGVSVVDI